MIIMMQLSLKQKYLQDNSPKPPQFEEERTRNFEKLLVLISTTQRSRWLSTGFNCQALIEGYKQVYGFSSQQFQTLITILANVGLKQEGLSTETRVYVLKLINTLTQYQIKITVNFTISNAKLIKLLESYAGQGVDGTLKNSDAVVEELSKFTLFFSRFGQEVVEEALGLAIDYNDMRYLVIFLRSLKKQSSAERLLTQLFSDNNLWDRDCYWFYILSEIIKKFPKHDYSLYFQTIMQEVIRVFTTLIDGDNQEALKKINNPDPFMQIQSVLKSIALALSYLLLPQTNPQHFFVTSCIERLFNLVITSLDHVNPPEYLNDLLGFVKVFVRAYLLRYRGERGQFLLFNEDDIEDHHEAGKDQLLIDPAVQLFFDSLWDQIIPKIVYLDDPQECKPSKIIAELCMYKPQKFLRLSMQAVLSVVSRDDPTLISLHGVKITILFLQEYIIIDQPQYLSIYIDCCSRMLGFVEKLGVPDNLDIIELVLRTFLYVNDEQINNSQVQNLMQDATILILANLDPMSIGLEGSEGDQAELYIDFANIFFPFILRLDQKQVELFTDKFIYRLMNQIPEHQNSYEQLSIALTFIDQSFAGRVFKHIYKQLITFQQTKESNGEKKEIKWEFISPVEGSLHPSNEQALKWYTSLLQCLFQYHPKNVVKHWPQIEKILNLLIIQWQNQSYLQLGLDIIYNILLCLCKPHLSWRQFTKWSNADYKTLNLNWQPLESSAKALIDYIFDKYFLGVEKYLREIYGEQLKNNQTEVSTLADFDTYIQKNQNGDIMRIRKRNLKLIDYVLIPDLFDPEDSDDRKIIYRALSVQYTVLSALMQRVPFHESIENIGDFFTQERYAQLRKKSCQYLQWVLQLLGHFNLMADEQFVKVFNYFWRQSHDEVSYSSAIDATNQKISPYYYPQLHRKKELLKAPFLIVNEAYLCHMARLEFHLIIAPTAHLNNPRYLESNFILGLNPSYEPSLHSYFPSYIDVHQYHRQLIAICRYHLDATNPQGYLFKFLACQDASQKERFNNAVKSLILSVKKLLNVFCDHCCMRDEFIRNTIFELISLYKILPKKNDKTLVYQMIYIMLVFSFDPLCLQETEEYSLTKYWNLRVQNSPQAADYQIVSIKQTPNLLKILQELERTELQFLDIIAMNRTLRLTRSCSYQHEVDIVKQMERSVTYLLNKIQEGILTLQKDFGVYLLMLLLYSNSLSLEHPLISNLIKLLFKLCQSQTLEIFDMSKTGLFHIINRFNYLKRKSIKVENTPLKRPWEEFLRFKYLGGTNINYERLKCQKSEQNFYPSKELTLYEYETLCSNPDSPTYKNEKVLLDILQDQVGIQKFLKNCSRDPDLKQTDQQTPQAMIVSEEDFKSISSSAHKLMHFVWDCNPSKTPLFMGVLERYQASPLNFYNRFFRKVFRIGSEKTRQISDKITITLRKGEAQEIRLSFYISCELMLRNPQQQMHKVFIDYLGECEKENFDFALMGIYGIFTSNFVTAERHYQIFLNKLRSIKGAHRFRHLQLLNTYMIAQGRFARKAAIEATQLLLKGINEGSDEVSEAVVSMITECFVQAVNLKNINEWVVQPLSELTKNKKIYLLNQFVGYNDEQLLIVLLTQLMKKARQQEFSVESTKLRIYSQIVRKILASITIFRFNQYFYKMLRQLILFVLERPQSGEDDTADQYVIIQLCGSEYPEEIYQDLVTQLLPMIDRTPYVIRKKLMFLQGLIIHRSFRLNHVDIPPLLAQNEKIITLDFIITVSTIARLMKSEELTSQVERILALTHRKKYDTYKLIALLMAAGVSEYTWKQLVMRDLVKHKKDKLVKESISEWWKGKSPETPQQLRLSELVRNFQNPYSYFA